MSAPRNLQLPPIEAKASWQLVRWCLRKGATEFTLAGVHVGDRDSSSVPLFRTFNQLTAHHALPAAPREHLSKMLNEEWERETELWRLNEETILALQQVLPDGIFSYSVGDEGWFEDLAIYRQGALMLGVISHEREGFLRVTEAEKAELESAGYCVTTLPPNGQVPKP